MRRLARILSGVPLLALLAVLGGCGKTKGVLGPNVAPQTFLFVQGAIDTVNHRVHLYWYGSDPDGNVIAFDVRTFNDSLPADTNWKRLDVASGAAYDSFFTVYTPSGYTDLRFEVRAVDNDGVVDPSPCIQDFGLSNHAPVVDLAGYPGITDTTYASLTFSWTATDPDGDGNQMRFRIWLDGNEANLDSTTGRTFTIPTAKFLRAGTFTTGYRTLYVQAIDDGGRFGPIDSTRWFVRAPGTTLVNNKGRILLVDDVPGNFSNNFTMDTLYANTMARNLPAGSYSVLRLSTTQPFRSAADLAQTFRQFDGVVWYRGDQPLYPFGPLPGVELLESYQDSIAAYLDSGGRFYLESLNPVVYPGSTDPNSRGPFSDAFMRNYLGSDSLRTNFNVLLQEPAVAWSSNSNAKYRSSVFADSLQAPGSLANVGIRGFAVRDTADVALWALPGQLSPANPEQMAVAVVVRRPAGGGKVLFTTYPIRFGRPAYSSVARLLAKLLFDPTRGLMAP